MKKPNSAAPRPATIGAASSAGSIGSAELRRQQPGGIGAEAEIGGVAEADDAADADQEVEAEGGEREAQHLDGDLGEVGVAGQRQQPAASQAAPRRQMLLGAGRSAAGSTMPSGSTTRAWPASGLPSRPQGRTTSTSAISRNTSTSVILGKTRMPKACSSPIISAARKAPGTEPMPPTTVTTKASAITEMSICGLAASLGVCSAPPRPGQGGAEEQRAGEQQRLVDAERADHLAILRRGPHQHAEARPVHQQPEQRPAPAGPWRSGTARRRESGGRGCRRRRRSPGARGPRMSSGPQILITRSCTTSTTPKVASSWNSSGTR